MIIAQAPLRVSLFGGGSDLPTYLARRDGAVLSFAINRRVFIIGHPFTHRGGLLLKYSKTEDVKDSRDLIHPIAKEIFTRYGISDFDVAVMSDVPAGTGLGSSSSFTVACLAFVAGLKGVEKTPNELAQEACEIEIEILKEPIGYQDQWASAFGDVNVLEFSGTSVTVRRIGLEDGRKKALAQRIHLIAVGEPRSAGQLLFSHAKASKPDSFIESLTDKLVELVPRGERALHENMDDLGPLLHEAWTIKRQIFLGVTSPLVEEMYVKGLAAGATGGKLLGAGGSGYLAFYVPEDRSEEFSMALPNRLSFEISTQGAGVIHES